MSGLEKSALEVVAHSAAVVSDMFGTYVVGIGSFMLLALASWCVGEGGEILGQKYDASIIGGLVIAWLNTGVAPLAPPRALPPCC